MRRNVLVTGGAGYIGSHTCLALIRAGWNPIVLDNFSNSSALSVDRIRELSGENVTLVEGDIRDIDLCTRVLREHKCTSVIHFAGLKAVGESQERALEYYDVNVVGSHSLLNAMSVVGIEQIVFSSSATVYGAPQSLPITEDHPLGPTNPYGQTKLAVENLIRDVAGSSTRLQYGILRYFNPVGAHSSAKIGEDPKGKPNNLMPFIAQVAVGRRDLLTVFGGDYDTRDGTGVRDYIHVSDLAEAHVCALQKLSESESSYVVNLGTGNGYSVLEVISAFSEASGVAIPHEIAERRPGDVATVYADVSYAQKLLGWKAERGLKEMCRDHWEWQKDNPTGYSAERT
ncbi:MAG: UDP-glucose 4-epimerase GalE [Henriciella sp.]